MANPYHDETGRFCSKGEMGEAVERVYQTMVSAPSGPAQEEAANAWFNLRNEFEATKKQELDDQRPDSLKLGQKNPERKANSALVAEAQATLPDRTADGFKRYTLPKGAMGFGSQEERYAQVVSTIAIQVLIEKAQQRTYVTSHASAKNVKDTLTKALGTFTEESGQAALQLSLERTQEIFDKHSRDHALASGGLQARIDVIPAIRDLERKALTTDIEDPSGKAEDLGAPAKPDYSYGKLWADKAADSFEERTSDLDEYEIPQGMSTISSLATTHNQRKAQNVTVDAVDSLLNARSIVNQQYADYRQVSKRLNSHFEVLRVTDDATHVSIDRVNAILKRESSIQDLGPNLRGPYVDVKAALRALENKAFTDDLHEPVPLGGADRNRAERSAQQREGVKAIRAARHAAPEEIPEEGRLTSETESARRWREAEQGVTRQPPRFIPASKKSGAQVNGPR